MRQFQHLILIGSVFMFTACATTSFQNQEIKSPKVSFDKPVCETENAEVFTGYLTANIASCNLLSENALSIELLPENTPINNSPWYGFYVKPKQTGTLQVQLNYKDGTHRYPPKISFDGLSWEWLDPESLTKISDHQVELKLPLSEDGYYVSAQEILTSNAHYTWIDQASQKSFLALSTIGQSKAGKPIKKLETDNGDKPYVILVGRQHPPELTGALAMMPFMDAVFGDSHLARKFRANFNILAVPLINPDGTDAGYWRHNFSGKDLNRDWGPFAEPETLAIKHALDKLEARGKTVEFFLDFHSTSRNLLYTQTDDEVTDPPMFAHKWLTSVDARLDDEIYGFTREPSPNSGRPTSKNYMYERYGIPAITYEVGDHTNREALSDAAIVFAEEMMILLLEEAGL